MNRIFELEAQNLQDTWSILYLFLSKALLQAHHDGESALRATVRLYGSYIGTAERNEQQKTGKKINLANFYMFPHYRFYDPRLYASQQQLNEQVALFDVIRCPFARMMKLYNGETEGKVFCEEYTAACIEAYTEKIAQVNVSEVLTEPQDTHCRIASYYRPGNFGTGWKETSFNSFAEEPVTAELHQELNQASMIWHQSAEYLVRAFSQFETNIAWPEEALSAGIEMLASFLKMRASSMERPIDLDFLSRNCALNTSTPEVTPLTKQLYQKLLAVLEL
jgi:hypothetical protein